MIGSSELMSPAQLSRWDWPHWPYFLSKRVVARIAVREELAPVGLAAIDVAVVEPVDVEVHEAAVADRQAFRAGELVGAAAAVAIAAEAAGDIAATARCSSARC